MAASFFTGILVSLVNLTEAKVAVYAEAHQRWQTMLNNRQLLAPPPQPQAAVVFLVLGELTGRGLVRPAHPG
jgi:hypothetical protein